VLQSSRVRAHPPGGLEGKILPQLFRCVFICRSSDWVAELVRQVQVDLGYELVRQVAVDVPAGSLMCMFALWDC
jgi:hypothetical protein